VCHLVQFAAVKRRADRTVEPGKPASIRPLSLFHAAVVCSAEKTSAQWPVERGLGQGHWTLDNGHRVASDATMATAMSCHRIWSSGAWSPSAVA